MAHQDLWRGGEREVYWTCLRREALVGGWTIMKATAILKEVRVRRRSDTLLHFLPAHTQRHPAYCEPGRISQDAASTLVWAISTRPGRCVL